MKMYREGDQEIKIFWRLIRHANFHPSFNREFLDKIYDFYDKHGYISDGQMKVLTRIYHKNKVNEGYDKDYMGASSKDC